MMLFLASVALAGGVFVNGVRADVLPPVTLERCTVRVDAQGNIYIDAPGYKVAVTQAGDAPTAAPPGMYGAPAGLPVAGVPNAGVAAVPGAGASASVVTSQPTREVRVPAPSGTWWLVTEDARSGGQSIEVRVNGTRVRSIRSGEPQLVLDIGPWLRVGDNVVEVLPGADAAAATGGSLSVYVGKGAPVAGVLRLDAPPVSWSRRAGEPAVASSLPLPIR